MQNFHHLRALALLGALTFYFFLWPICCCAAKPTWSPLATQNIDISSAGSLQSDRTTNQTYQDLMTGISDINGTKEVDFSNNPSANYTKSNSGDKGSMEESESNLYAVIDNENAPTISGVSPAASDSMTTSIYELFAVRKGKRKFASSNQVLSRTDRSVHLNSSNNRNNSVSGTKRVKNKTKLSTLERNERSANLSHITGSARKIQLYIKNRFLQLLPDGSVNGTTDDLSDYSKFCVFSLSTICCQTSKPRKLFTRKFYMKKFRRFFEKTKKESFPQEATNGRTKTGRGDRFVRDNFNIEEGNLCISKYRLIKLS